VENLTAVIISILSLLVSCFSVWVAWRKLGIANNEYIAKNRPYIILREYQYQGSDGNYMMHGFIHIIAVNSPALITKESYKIIDNEGEIYDEHISISDRIMYHISNGESKHIFSNFFKLITPSGIGKDIRPEKAEGFKRIIEISYRGLNDFTLRKYSSEHIFKNNNWQVIYEKVT